VSSFSAKSRAVISRMRTSLRLGASDITSSLSALFYVLMGLAVALCVLCGLVILLGELWIFLRAPLGFKDESLTGIPALAEIVVWPLAGGALVFWFVAWLFGSLSDRSRCTSYFYPGISDEALRHAPRCSLMPGHSSQHFCEVSGRKYYWQSCARCGKSITGSELCEMCRLLAAGQEAIDRRAFPTNLAGMDAPWTAGGEDLERAVQEAMSDTGATSETEMDCVIKAAKIRLWSKGKARFDENELSNAVRAHLRGKRQALP